VSKGTNRQLVIESLFDIQKTLSDPGLQSAADWKVELVTDNFMDITELNSDVRQIVVPTD